MADPQPNIQSILAALGNSTPHSSLAMSDTDRDVAAQRPGSTPGQTPPGVPNQGYQPPSAAGQPGHYQAPPQGAAGYGPPPGLPAPASSGNVDLSAIRPVNSGTLNFEDIVSRARAVAAEKGATSYNQPLVYNADSRDANPYRSRSRSPRGDYHNNQRDDRRGGYGRDYGRDRSHSPGPRGGSRHFSPRGGNRERSPLRGGGGGGDDNSEVIEIESSLVGLIIGRQGENLRRIEADSNCRVQFLASTDGGPMRQCKISGPRARRAEVKDAINQIIEDSGMGALNRGGDRSRQQDKNPAAAPLREGEDHIQIMVPDRTVGLIIGRGGETIRDLQERSGCHINIVGESKSVNGLRPVNLIGTPEAAKIAKDAIMDIVDSDSRGEATGSRAGGKPPGRDDGGSRGMGGGQFDGGRGGGGGGHGDKINDTVYVPSDAVGMIIGKGGETIREMQNSTGCKINVQQGQPGESEREITLIGSRDSIAQAKQAIEEKVDAVVRQVPGR